MKRSSRKFSELGVRSKNFFNFLPGVRIIGIHFIPAAMALRVMTDRLVGCGAVCSHREVGQPSGFWTPRASRPLSLGRGRRGRFSFTCTATAEKEEGPGRERAADLGELEAAQKAAVKREVRIIWQSSAFLGGSRRADRAHRRTRPSDT